MLKTVADFLYTFVEGGDSDEDDELHRKKSHGPESSNGTPLQVPYPGRILKIPKTCTNLPPEPLRRRHPEPGMKLTSKNTGTRALPGGVTPGGWVPPGCGCFLDVAQLVQEIDRPGFQKPMRPRCVLRPCQMHMIVDALPTICKWAPWDLAFSTDEHGFSIPTLRRAVTGLKQLLLVLKTTCGHVFGAFLSHAPDWSHTRFIGSAETFVYHFRNGTLLPYHWTGANSYFISTMTDGSFAVGGGGTDGSVAFYIDGDLRKGRTGSCPTFGSPPLLDGDHVKSDAECLHAQKLPTFAPDGPEKSFVIQRLEIWDFVPGGAQVASNRAFSLLRDSSSPIPPDPTMTSGSPSPELCDEEEPLCQWHKVNNEHHLCYLQS